MRAPSQDELRFSTSRRALRLAGLTIVLLLGAGGFAGLRWNQTQRSYEAGRKVPPGSRLSELDQLYPADLRREGRVVQWLPIGPNAIATADRYTTEEKSFLESRGLTPFGSRIDNDFGVFEAWYLGTYADWTASQEERDSFTGEISFFRHGWRPDVNTLIYVKGRLVKTEYGFLPG